MVNKEYEVLSMVTRHSTRSYHIRAGSKEEAIELVEAGDVDVSDEWDDDSKEDKFEAKICEGEQ